MVSSEDIRVDFRKIEDVKSWSRSTTLTGVESFLGLADCCIRFIEGFSSIAFPLTKLIQNAIKFQWFNKLSRSVERHIDFSTSLSFVKGTKGCAAYVYCNASRK